jgi:hypothetical protein
MASAELVLLIINTIFTFLIPIISSLSYLLKHIRTSECFGNKLVIRDSNIKHNRKEEEKGIYTPELKKIQKK